MKYDRNDTILLLRLVHKRFWIFPLVFWSTHSWSPELPQNALWREGPSYVQKLEIDVLVHGSRWSQTLVNPARESNMWVEKLPDDSSSQSFKSSLAVPLFRTEGSDWGKIYEAKKRIFAVLCQNSCPQNLWAQSNGCCSIPFNRGCFVTQQ